MHYCADLSVRFRSVGLQTPSQIVIRIRSSPRVTSSGTAKEYRPSILMCSKISGDNRARSSSSTGLILLAFAVALAKLAAFAMKHGAGQAVPAFAAIQLAQGGAALGLIIDVGQGVQRPCAAGSGLCSGGFRHM